MPAVADTPDDEPRETRGRAALIVNYRSAALAVRCVASIRADAADLGVWIVDNASDDDSVARLRDAFADDDQVQLVALEHNGGFGAGCNAGITRILAAEPELRSLLLINPDAEVRPGCIAALQGCADRHAEAGIVGARIFAGNGTTVWFENGRYQPWTLSGSHRAAPADRREFPTGFVTGCVMWIDAALLRDGLRFAEDYFLYVEDLDLCRRAVARGGGLWITLDAEVVHHEGGSQTGESLLRLGMRRRQLRYVTRNKIRFARRHLRWPQRWCCYAVMIAVKPLVGVIHSRSTDFLGPYARGLLDGFLGRSGPIR